MGEDHHGAECNVGVSMPENDDTLRDVDKGYRLLLWPSSALSEKRKGFVLGWKTLADDNKPSSKQNEQNKWPNSMVVAGVIPQSETLDKEFSIEQELRLLRNKIQSIRKKSCYCCTCSNLTETSRPCSGCSRRMCFEELDVVAFHHSSTTNHKENSLPKDLPHIYDTAETGYPWIERSSSIDGRGQLLIYDDIRDKQLLYRHSPSAVDSLFSRVILPQITHATCVMELLTSMDHSERVTLSEAVPRVEAERPTAAPSQTEELTKAENPVGDTALSAFLSFVSDRSLFLRHFADTSRDGLSPLRRLSPLPSDDKISPVNRPNCPVCQRNVLLQSKYESAHDSLTNFDGRCRAALDAVAGFLLGIGIVIFMSSVLSTPMLTNTASYHFRLLREGMIWLESFPIGFKLNERLTEHMGREMRSWIALQEWFAKECLSTLSSYTKNAVAVALFAIGTVSGCSTLMAIFFDLFRLANLHISFFAACYRHVYRAELHLLAALWRLFRGKKRNILRNRTDTMDYDSMQLLLGTILFAVALFLFTTVLVYYTFFAVLNIAATLCFMTFASAYYLFRCFPLGTVLLRFLHPDLFTDEVYFEEVNTRTKRSSLYCTRLVSVPESYASILSEALARPIRAVLSWPVNLIREYITGRRRNEQTLVCSLIDSTRRKR